MRYIKDSKGQALVTLLVFMSVAIIVTSGAIIASIVNLQGTQSFSNGETALSAAESGADVAIIRLLRNPENFIEASLSVGTGTATITVTGDDTKTIISEGTSGMYKRRVQVVGTLSNNVFNITSWTEID